LKAIDLINEPTAAVLAWMLESGKRPEGGLLVYDLGGGTFDSVAVRITDDALEVVTIGGDNVLGGHDWDRALTLQFNELFQRKNATNITPTADPRTDNAWLDKAEFAKIFLASNPSANDVQVVLQHDKWVTPIQVTREMYDEITKNLRDRTLVATMWVLHHAKEKLGLKPHSVLLAGGMSRLPSIKSLLDDRLGLTPVAMSRPDYMVAEGAALWALKRSTERHLNTTDAEVISRHLVREYGLPEEFAATLSRLKVKHVTSRGFAIQYRDSKSNQLRLEFLARAQEALPISATWSGITPADDIRDLHVCVFEENAARKTDDPRHHLELGKAVMADIPRGYPRGTPIEVTFTLDMDQVIHVSFTHPGKPESAKARIYVGAPRGAGELKPK
jgi:molecular chaperone DnaK (HSP70)